MGSLDLFWLDRLAQARGLFVFRISFLQWFWLIKGRYKFQHYQIAVDFFFINPVSPLAFSVLTFVSLSMKMTIGETYVRYVRCSV